MRMQKKRFRIGELAQKLGVERFVIRFWEKEFSIKAHRSEGRQRFYEEKDFELFKHIKDLLYNKGFTIAGAKKQLRVGDRKIIASKRIPTTAMQTTPREKELSQKIVQLQKKLIKLRELL